MKSSSGASSCAVGALAMWLLILMAGCGYDGTAPYGGGGVTSGRTATIAVLDDFFSPQLDTVSVGSTVTWTNQGGTGHTTTSDAGLWESGVMPSGQSFGQTFSQTGAFPYHCRIHGAAGGIGMSGTIIVVP